MCGVDTMEIAIIRKVVKRRCNSTHPPPIQYALTRNTTLAVGVGDTNRSRSCHEVSDPESDLEFDLEIDLENDDLNLKCNRPGSSTRKAT